MLLHKTAMDATKWNVHYAKFFTFPTSVLSCTSSDSLLKPLGSGLKGRLKGTWVPSSSGNASIHFSIHNSQPIVVVSINGDTYEEHYLSKLNFIWPQGNSPSKSSVRRSKVIFACYSDKMGQIQKFAMRFSSSNECQKFVEALKGLMNGSDDANISSAMVPIVFSEGIERDLIHTQQTGRAPESADVALPETALLTDCCTADDPDASGIRQAPAEIDLKHFLTTGNKGDKALIDLLEKMDNIIVGLGGDLRFITADA